MTLKYGNLAQLKSNGEVGFVVYVDTLMEEVELMFSDNSFYKYKLNNVKQVDSSYIKKIALIAKMRAGKDTVAEYLVNNYGYKRFAFGDELKRYYHELFGDTDSKPRKAYQEFGQKMREINPQIWVNKCFDQINRYPLNHVVISDLRQPNEYERCRQEGFTVIKVVCDDEIRLERIRSRGDNFTLNELNHETESYIDQFEYDYLIENNDNIQSLRKQVDMIIEEIHKQK